MPHCEDKVSVSQRRGVYSQAVRKLPGTLSLHLAFEESIRACGQRLGLNAKNR